MEIFLKHDEKCPPFLVAVRRMDIEQNTVHRTQETECKGLENDY